MRKSDIKEWLGLALVMFAAVIVVLALTGAAWAACPPNTRDVVPLKEYMDRAHGEHPRIMGWMHGKTLIIYTNPKTRAWTAFVIDEAMACAAPVAAGSAWTEMDLPPVGDPS